jgi:hypothetical protein
MARPKKIPTYLILYADRTGYVNKEFVYDRDSDPDESPLDELDYFPADDLLDALRQSFSLTYLDDLSLKGMRNSLAKIRRLGVDVLKMMPKALADLGLKPVPTNEDDPALNKTVMFKFAFMREADLNIKVTFEGKKRRFLDLLDYEIATPLIQTMREVVADTFEEAFDDDQHERLLRRIRGRIWKTLPAYNVCLESIGIEPIAEYRADAQGSADKSQL